MVEKKGDNLERSSWHPFAMALVLVMLACLAMTIYGLTPENTFLWNTEIQTFQPFGPDRVTLDDNSVVEGLVSIEAGETPEDPEMVKVLTTTGESKVFDKKVKVKKISIVHCTIRPMSLVVAALFLVSLMFFWGKISCRLEVYKPGQGPWVRGTTYLFILGMTVFGVVTMYRMASPQGYWGTSWIHPFESGLLSGFELRPVLFPCIGIGLLTMFVCHALMSKAAWAEFLVETEGELKKVSWPWNDFAGSSMVVLVVSITLALFIFGVDKGWSKLLSAIGIGF